MAKSATLPTRNPLKFHHVPRKSETNHKMRPGPYNHRPLSKPNASSRNSVTTEAVATLLHSIKRKPECRRLRRATTELIKVAKMENLYNSDEDDDESILWTAVKRTNEAYIAALRSRAKRIKYQKKGIHSSAPRI
jgi:hypothetical protein